jgi:ABC-type thiamine transport system ATPase subunit
VRKLFGVLFQDGALFGSMNIYDNVAFPLREHTRRSEAEIRRIVGDKLELVGLTGAERKLPGQISGGMRKRAGLARALVLDPQIMLFDEPDSGLDPVRTAYLNQLIVDLNQQTHATFLIVTHDINTARTVPDNIGLLYRGHLAMFGPREMLLTSSEPVVRQFLNAQRIGPIGMAEEKDAAEREAEVAAGAELPPLPPVPPAVAAVRRAAPARRTPDVHPGGAGMADVVTVGLRGAGTFFTFCLDTARAVVRRPFQVRELIGQAWFLSSVSILPAALVSIPFGAVIALQLGSLVRQLGAQSFTGAASVLAVVREAGPIVTALIIAGAGGSAICADLGARRIREELDAMQVLGIDPIQRLVVPRVLASMLVAVLLNGLVSVVGVAGGYVFNVVMQGGNPGRVPGQLPGPGTVTGPGRGRGEGPRVRRDRGAGGELSGHDREGRPQGRR